MTNAICDRDLRMTVSFSSALTSSAEEKSINGMLQQMVQKSKKQAFTATCAHACTHVNPQYASTNMKQTGKTKIEPAAFAICFCTYCLSWTSINVLNATRSISLSVFANPRRITSFSKSSSYDTCEHAQAQAHAKTHRERAHGVNSVVLPHVPSRSRNNTRA